MTIVRGEDPEQNFFMHRNETARDRRLSFRARGVLAELLSRPAGWRVDARELSQGEDVEGREAVRSALNELEKVGYLRRRKFKDKGRWKTEAVVYSTPHSAQEPVMDEQADEACGQDPHRAQETGAGSPDSGFSGPLERQNLEDGKEDELLASPPAPHERSLPGMDLEPQVKQTDLFQALVEACGINPAEITKRLRGGIGGAAKELLAVGATPADVLERAEMHRRAWPQATVTAPSLAKNWAMLPALQEPRRQTKGAQARNTIDDWAAARSAS